ncbi:unnamed protein product [Adineta steineri]|uniref:G-protein coupled receptors family 1 profile domain-containing protein n=1 Tax=Adineta steineri TaxID=433720 RepID=A0A819XLK6_9BILA|nr:unnamed protein product [Adineta steineri]CAF4142534.1 unnamed protein product [Adineta steineri]
MSSSNINANTANLWNTASNDLNRYLPIFIYTFGIIGNFLNVLVLAQSNIRSNSSAVLFLFSSMASLIAIVSGLTSRMMSGYAVDLTLTVNWICIIRNYILYTARTITLWLIALATIERWLASSKHVHRRQKSTLKNARRGMILVFIYACLINAPIIYCYRANLSGSLRGCYGSTYACSVLTDGIYVFGTTLSSLSVMIIFGLMTINNIRHSQNRVQNIAMLPLSLEQKNTISTVNRPQKIKKIDRHLLKMLIVQVTLLILFTCPHAIQKFYSSAASISLTSSSQSLDIAIPNFIFNLVTLLNFTASGMPFYIYTLTGGSVFRRALFHLIKTVILKILCR